jgi:hypothetical protein
MLTGSSSGYTTLFKFLSYHWDTIKERFASSMNLWTGIVRSATGFFNTQKGYDMVSKLYAERRSEFGNAEPFVIEAMENIMREMKWSEKNLPVIDQWLTDNLVKPLVIDKDMQLYWKTALACPNREAQNTTAPAS